MMIALRANILINRRGRVRFLAALHDFIEKARAENGCTYFVVAEDVRESNRFYVIGEFESDEALDTHEEAAHTETFRSTIAQYIDSREPTLVFTISQVQPLQRS